MPPLIAGIVLAAGRASRYGTTKQVAFLRNRPLVVHVADKATRAGLSPVLVITGHDTQTVAAALPSGVQHVHNPEFRSGQASSLRCGIAVAQANGAAAAVILLADQPDISVTAIQAVMSAHADGATVARAAYTDRPGHPVLFDRAIWPMLQELTGDIGARDLLGTLDVTEVPIAERCPPDIDLPADLLRATRRHVRDSGR